MEITQNQYANQELLCCRACLVTDCKLFDIHEYKLADVFTNVSGTPVEYCKLNLTHFGSEGAESKFGDNAILGHYEAGVAVAIPKISKDGFSQYLCLYCRSLLLKCASFRRMCAQTQHLLMPELIKGELHTDGIRRINRLSHRLVNLTLSVVRLVDCVEPPAKHIKNEPNDTDEVNIDETKMNKKIEIEIELNNDDDYDFSERDSVDVDIVKKDDLSLKLEKKKDYIELKHDNDDELPVKNIKNLRTRKRTIGTAVKKTVDTEKKKKTTKVKKKKAEFKTDDKSKERKKKDIDVDKKDKKPAKETKRGRPQKEGKRKFRNPANDFMPVFDFSKFENSYGVQIVTLSKQEQLDEIAARKQTNSYQESRYQCEDCGRGFDMEAAYKNHLLRHHPNAGQYVCEVCAVRFHLKSRQHRHQDLHRLKFVCRECGFISRQSGNAKVHYEVHQGRKFVCQHCGKSYSKRSTYLSHVRLAHPAMNVACDECGETFVGQVGLKLHKKLMHSEITSPQQFKCFACPASFVSLDALNRHTDSGEHTGRPCEQCGESCASEEALQAHVGERHPKESHRCEECCATFPSASVFELHYRRKHLGERGAGAGGAAGAGGERKKQARPPPRRSTPRKQFVCETCGHISPNAAKLRYHQNNHLAVKPFACPVCPKTFATNSVRNWHARRHTGEKPFKCPLCPLAFNAKGNFQRHHKTVHLGLHENVPCSICGRVFTTKSSLRLHVNSVHNGQPWPKRDRTRTKKEHQLQ